jgi:glycosyltransferase involved in cell wall biosynthesis
MKGLRVGLIASPWVTVPPTRYGGSELVIDQLAQGLTELGCHVVLFATGDSTCAVERRWLHPEALGTSFDLMAELRHVHAAYGQLDDVDIVHDHTILGPQWAALNRVPYPVVSTVHGEFSPELEALYRAVGAKVHLVAISHAQRRSAPGVPIRRVIHHGLDLSLYPPGPGDGGYLLFMGRMNANKGAHRAIQIARRAGRRLLLAAKIWEDEERRYFAEQVEPLLGDDAVYVGEVGGTEKLGLLGGAEGLLNPIRWPEPFGLVMIEAPACGTPVLSFDSGAAPEIVEDGRTGFVCRSEADMVAKIDLLGKIDRAGCRARAEERFSTRRMAADHLDLYEELVEEAAGSPRSSVA